MPATLTYRPLTPQNSAKLLRTNTCRFARFAEPRCPHTSGVRVCSCTSIATEPCRPTACAGEYPCCTFTHPATAHYSLLTANSSYTFSAKERDSETGLSYFGSRYYSSDLSIWLSVDPMSDKYPSLSPYTYCADNPVKLVDPNGDSIINKYALQLLKANNYVDALNERLSGLEKGTSEYRMTNKALSAAIDYRNIIKNKYEIVNNAISDFKEHCPKNYEKLNHLKDPTGFPVDIIVSLDFYLNKGENRGLSIINYRQETLPFSKTNIYFFNSVKMILNPRSCLDRDDIGRTFAHEGGHIYYEVTDPAGYKEWLDKNMISPVPGYDGHGEGDPSGNEAKKWEKAY